MTQEVSEKNLVPLPLEKMIDYHNLSDPPLFKRFYTKPDKNVYDLFEYELRTAEIKDKEGKTKFKQENVEFPKEWSQTATNIVSSKYFKRSGIKKEYGGSSEGLERSVKSLIYRVANTFRNFGFENGYFNSKEQADIFEDELTYILLSQRAAFNSPVWFNLGLFHHYNIVEPGELFYFDLKLNEVKKSKDSFSHPQLSACFINSVEDTMFGDHSSNDHSIFKLVETEAKLFKYGSGTGTNFSDIRASGEKLSGGGTSSGLTSFLKILDSDANAVKSGGKTRRAAKMVILNSDHPDIEEFINWKADGERKARALAAFGYDVDMDGLYKDIYGQNSNNSIRVTDEFMKAVLENRDWDFIERTTGKVRKKVKARDLFEKIAKAAWVSGDPGIQYHTTINDWHTCPNSAEIKSSNPCSEYMFIDDSACNLSSINLMKFMNKEGGFDNDSFKHTVDIMITAQEIAVDLSGYPTQSIAKNSHDFRPLGLGYANLGAFLMSRGIPYESEEAFNVAGVIASIMTAEAYRQSAKLSSIKNPFNEFEKNKEPFLKVIKKHRENVDKLLNLNSKIDLEYLIEDAKKEWDSALSLINLYGSRNSQTTVLAPTGTISFMMDCDTTGIEPEVALVKYKQLSGKSGTLKLINSTIPTALSFLGYDPEQIKDIEKYIIENDTIEGSPNLRKEHLRVFDCSLVPEKGKRVISPMGHIRMMASVQPFLSGAISKTVNLLEYVTPKDVYNIYLEAWKHGLKSIAIYRDKSKLSQPLSTGQGNNLEDKLRRGEKRSLPKKTESYTIRVNTKGGSEEEHKVHIICGEYEDGTLGEIRVQMFDQASPVQGFLNNLTVAWSEELKYGIPLKKIVKEHIQSKFEPSGVSDYPYVRAFTSIPNLVWRIVGLEYLGVDDYIEITGDESIKERVKNPFELRINRNKARLLREKYLAQIMKIDEVINNPINHDIKTSIEPSGNGGNNGDNKKDNQKKHSSGLVCTSCGAIVYGIGCVHCSNCGTQLGGGCPS